MLGLGSLVALHLAFFWRAAVLRGFLIHGDILYFFEPAKSLLHECLRAGRLPLWSPYILCGYPVAAEGQIAAFSPLSLLISWLLPSPAAINWLVISSLLIAAVSTYLLARLLGLSPLAAWLAALTYSFSGYLFAHIQHISLLCAASWLPLVIYFVERAWRGSTVANGTLGAAAWALSALSGHPQTLFQISLVVIFWVVWRWAGSAQAERRREIRRAAAITGLVFGLGLGLAAVQVMMTWDLSSVAPHGEKGSLSYVTSFSLLPEHLVGLVSPNHEGSPAFDDYAGDHYYWEYVVYIGLVPLALSILAATRRRYWALAGLAAGGLVLALAAGNPLYQVLRFVPGFADFRAPARYVLLFTFAASLLAGYGWQAIAGWRWFGAGRRLMVAGAIAALLAAADLLWFDRTLAPLASRSVFATPEVASALSRDRDWGRAMVVSPLRAVADWTPIGGWLRNADGWGEMRAGLPADAAQSFGLRIVDGYAGFTNPDQKLFFASAYGAAQVGDLEPMSLVGTRNFALPSQATVPGLAGAPVGRFTVSRNPAAFPRVFAAADVVQVGSPTEAHRAVIGLAQRRGLRQTAVVLGSTTLPRSPAKVAAELSVREPRPERIEVRAQVDRDCVLVLNERYDRGWRASVDGHPSPLLDVDAVLMGTTLTKGGHSVVFSYHPTSFVAGGAISLVSLALAAGLLAVPLFGRRATPEAGAARARGRQ